MRIRSVGENVLGKPLIIQIGFYLKIRLWIVEHGRTKDLSSSIDSKAKRNFAYKMHAHRIVQTIKRCFWWKMRTFCVLVTIIFKFPNHRICKENKISNLNFSCVKFEIGSCFHQVWKVYALQIRVDGIETSVNRQMKTLI